MPPPSARATARHQHHQPTTRRAPPHWPLVASSSRRCRPLAAPPPSALSSAAPSLSSSSLDEPSSSTPAKIRIRLARPQDYWEASDLHCATFFEQETPHQRTRRLNQSAPPPGPPFSPRGALAAGETRWMPLALRVDRCVSLQLNDDLQRRGVGRTALLLAEMDVEDEVAAAMATATTPTTTEKNPLAFPRPLFFLSRLLSSPVRAGLDKALQAAATSPPSSTVVVGAATVDSFGDLVPPKQLDPGRDGAFGWMPRHGGDRNHYAYVSNVAVAPFVRRRGVARQLVRAAERLAAGWGGVEGEEGRDDASDADDDDASPAPPDWSCGAAALHCSPENEAALRLYGGMGYRRVALEPAWAPYLNGRGAGGRCYLMVRRLKGPAAAVEGGR